MRNRLASLAGSSPAGFLPDETSTRSLSAIGQRSGVRRNRRCAVQGRMVTKKASVRSVRTRRYTRSSRGGTTRNIVQGFRSSLDGKKRPECRVDTVNHGASPSRRESARRAIKCFQSQSAATEHPLVRRCAAAYLSLPSSTRSRASRSQSLHRWPASHFFSMCA